MIGVAVSTCADADSYLGVLYVCTTTSLLLAVLTPTEYAVRVRVGGVR
jgi:hypothetical protein